MRKFHRALLGHHDADNDCDNAEQQVQSIAPEIPGSIHHHSCKRRQVCAKALEDSLKLRDDINQQNRGYDDCNGNDGSGIVQGFLDFTLDALYAFFVGGNIIEYRVQNARTFTGLHEVGVKFIELNRILAQGFVQ